jgi:hypothetical protein
VGERQSSVHIARAEQPANNQFGVGADGRPGPNITGGRRSGFGTLHVAGLGVNEAPDFIHLDALAAQVAQRLVLISSAGVSGLNQ